MQRWEFIHDTVAPGEDRYSVIRQRCADGWEPFCIEKTETGWREIYFKRPVQEVRNPNWATPIDACPHCKQKPCACAVAQSAS